MPRCSGPLSLQSDPCYSPLSQFLCRVLSLATLPGNWGTSMATEYGITSLALAGDVSRGTSCRGCGPKTPRRSCSTRSCRLSHSFWRLFKMLRQILNNLQASLQDTYNNRQHTIAQAGGKRTVMHTHTRCSTRLLTQRRNFPKACELTEQSRRVQCKSQGSD